MRNLGLLSLCLSITLHLLLFGGVGGISLRHDRTAEFKQIEIFPEEEILVESTKKNERQELALNKPPQFMEEFAKKTILKSSDDFLLEKPAIESPAKEIVFAEIDMQELMEVKKTPEYMEYYNIIREKIRDNALSYYQKTIQGVVHLSFIILNDGNLYHLNLLDDSTSDNDLLRIAMNSVKDAAPFPPFPQTLAYPKLHFNVSIHFKNN